MVTLTKFLVIVTFTVVFVLGSAFISGEKQKDDEELEDLDNSFLSEKGSFKDEPVLQEEKSQELLNQENSDHYWDDVIDSDEDPDIIFPQYVEKNTFIKNSTKKSPLLLVSTLDGTLSALDASDQGNILWKIETGPGSLLSSSISKVELNSHGKLVRLIPSLDGGLYKFDGEGIEPIPISADSLLHSSYHAADDLLITGGKEVRTYGVDVRTGHVQYVCSADGCHVEPAEAGTSTFSECKSSSIETPEKQMECFINHSTENDYIEADSSTEILKPYPMEFKVIVPDGVVCAINPERPGQVLWKYKFESPVVHVWKLIECKFIHINFVEGNLTPLDLFNPNFVPALESQPNMYEDLEAVTTPLLYVGIHNHQLYVQESARIADFTTSDQSNQEISGNPSTSSSALTPFRVRWQPLTAKTSLVGYQGRPGRFTTSTAVSTEDKDEASTKEHIEENNDPKITAMIVRHQTDYPYDRGFYLFKENKPQKKTKRPISQDKNAANIEEEEEELWEGGRNTPVHIVIVSLWFWWREVVVNFLQQRWAIELHRHISAIVPPLARLTAPEIDMGQEKSISQNTPSSDIGVDCDQPMKSVVVPPMANQISIANGPPSFVSRYLTDFEPIQCLGRGGFGLVFEVRNRLDDCHYAVKRIQLPNSEEAREKVMREVKALTKLDNPHIEFQDAAWIDSESITGPTPFNTGEDSCISKMEPFNTDDFMCSKEKSTVDQFRLSNLISSIDSLAVRRKSLTNDSFDIVFEDSSRKTKSSCNEIRFEDETSDICSKSNSTRDADGSYAIIRRSSGKSGAKNIRRNVQKSPNYTRSDAKMFLFIQMQLCRKESLREWLRAHVSHRDTYQVIQMFNEIVRAVEYVHLQGLIHRDLKPSNIFFAPDGAIKIGDFGLVTAMAEEAFYSPMSPEGNAVCGGFSPFQRTHTDQVGTQLYMSPEQIEGQPYNHKVDIYSLGLILVELLWPLTTQMEQVTVISQLRKLKFPPGFIEKYPEEAVLLHKMLSRNPDERPTTYGIRASTPLRIYQDSTVEIPEYLHFSLLRPRSTTRTSSGSSS
uniref:non-specific serine/threonine protein kinase n=1 Tax=Daphnia galeata TaxID=27404 RepID=A0A8J2WKB6_9CRUS|nr:unnamed protein product [Daphnia galeata]